jgi:sugar/nucleoside kinase (ribokinase family)
MTPPPDIVVVGQLTVDHVVPAEPGPWRAQIGGNALYAAAGARLWVDPARIGIVARIGSFFPPEIAGILDRAGIRNAALVPVAEEHIVEWFLYEPDGSRRSVPRNVELRDPLADTAALRARYLARLAALSATLDDIPAEWIDGAAVHLAPQVAERHRATVGGLAGRVRFLAVDPSPHYTRQLDLAGLAEMLRGATALLPSRAEIEHLAHGDWPDLAASLAGAGFAEVAIKLGADGVILAEASAAPAARLAAAPATPVDPTGAGDAFCGAYAACRALGLKPREAARRGIVAAAMVVETRGADAALALDPAAAAARLAHSSTEDGSMDPDFRP